MKQTFMGCYLSTISKPVDCYTYIYLFLGIVTRIQKYEQVNVYDFYKQRFIYT